MKSKAQARRKRVNSLMPFRAWVIVCTSISFLVLTPLILSLLSSLKDPREAQESPPRLWPRNFSLDNYKGLTEVSDGVTHYILNSFFLAILTLIGTAILASLAGFGFARYNFRGKTLAFGSILLMIMIPFQAILTPLYILFGQLNLINNLFGLALIYITYQLPFAIFIMRNSFADIPVSIEEAAMVDGCTPIKIFRRVMLPLVVPGVISVSLFSFFAAWNEFLAALIFMNDQTKYTLPIMLTLLNSKLYGQINWGLMQAGVIITMIPCVVLFLTLQKYYIQGLMSGSVKG
jgi:multiple sugar transport system permease protein